MDPLPPIHTPVHLRWREFRVRFLPVIFFGALVSAAVFLWRTNVQPVTIVGQAETNSASVISIENGTLVELTVDLLDRVSKDQVIGRIAVADSSVTEATLETIAADLRVTQARMDLDKIRNLDSYTRLREELLAEEMSLKVARARLTQAEAELQRARELFKKGLIPQGLAIGQGSVFGVDVAERDRDTLQAEIEYRSRIVAQLQAKIGLLDSVGATNVPPRDPIIDEAIKAQQEQLALQTRPINLRAPIDGVVSMVFAHPGEKVVRGSAVIAVSPLSTDRIVGHIRQPINRAPTTNDLVRVRTRGTPSLVGAAPIVKVGTQLEPINPYLLSPDGSRHELGLPILISIPAGIQLRPGEYVDLSIEYSQKK